MKVKYLFCVLLASAFMGVSCNDEYDDTLLQDRVDGLENRIEKLEEICSQLNTNVSSLQSIVNVLNERDYVTSVTPVTKEGETIGYTISFGKNDPVTIYNGIDGNTPVIGVAKYDKDGLYYWTLDGEWLLNEKDEMVRAEGVDGEDGATGATGATGAAGAAGAAGVTPKFQITEDGKWQVSYNNGTSWDTLGQATGATGPQGQPGDKPVITITNDENKIIIKVDGVTELEIPKFAVTIENGKTGCQVKTGQTLELNLAIPEGVNPVVISNWDAKISGDKLTINVPKGAAVNDTETITVMATNGFYTAMSSFIVTVFQKEHYKIGDVYQNCVVVALTNSDSNGYGTEGYIMSTTVYENKYRKEVNNFSDGWTIPNKNVWESISKNLSVIQTALTTLNATLTLGAAYWFGTMDSYKQGTSVTIKNDGFEYSGIHGSDVKKNVRIVKSVTF